MNILIVALELSPYVQSSGAGDSVASLSKALRLLGHDLTLLVPHLAAYQEGGLMAARQLTPLVLKDGREATLYDAQLSSGVRLSLVDVGGAPFTSDSPCETQPGPLGAFASAVAAYVKRREAEGTIVDVVHAHDACAGLALFKLTDEGAGGLAKVLTVHDAARAGEFPLSALEVLGIPEERSGSQGFGSGEGLCLLKGLVREADAIVVPSDSYATQLKAPEKYGALSRAFQAVELFGVREGVDHAVYNPSTDPALVSRYDGPNPANKARNKVDVLRELSLEFDPSRPLVFCEDVPFGESAMASLLTSLPGLVRNDITIVVLGSAELRDANTAVLDPVSTQVRWLTSATPALRRRILAGADFYLSVQKRDPSGQRLLQASRYGTVPIAFLVDAVPDVVVDCDSELRTGTGIVYSAMTQRALLGAAARAVSAYRSGSFSQLMSRVMRQDLAWDRSARRHEQIYRSVVAAHG